jgi:hypothetical protein
METDYFSLRLLSLTVDLNVPEQILKIASGVARETFEDHRRAGAMVSQAIERAEESLLETLAPTLNAASRLKDILATDFAHVPALSTPPHFGNLVENLMPLLSKPASRLTDAYIVGLLTDYTDTTLQ